MKVAVVIPCYRVKQHVLEVISQIGTDVSVIYAVDDKCPDQSGKFIEENVTDARVRILYNEKNKGVGGAVIAGYMAALADGCDIMVKVDGDGQMDPALIPLFVDPIASGEADYAKGNRFFAISSLKGMPKLRLFGNAFLSFLTKLSSGYWRSFDPTNGYTAIHRKALMAINVEKLAERYFFETDMLIKLGDARAVVVDVPMHAVYGEETSNLKITSILGDFLIRHLRGFLRRIFYSYFVRDFNIASINLFVGFFALLFGVIFGLREWMVSISTGDPATTGTVMLAVLPIVTGVQMLLFFFGYDMQSEPSKPIQGRMSITSLEASASRLQEIDRA